MLVRKTGNFFIDKSSLKRTILLSGSGRSGTTWLADIINFDNSYRLLFEPFHSYKVDILKEWSYRQYLRNDNVKDKYILSAKRILNGKFRNRWVDQFNTKRFYSKRLIKDIRINLILKWISVHFPEIPIILLLRHPCAVAVSKIKLKWNTHLDEYLEQNELMSDFLLPFKSHIENVTDDFEKHIFMWCIDNFIPLKQFKKRQIHLVFYENLCINYADEVRNMFDYLGMSFNQNVLKAAGKASALSRDDSPVRHGKNLITEWKKFVTRGQLKSTKRILSIFGLDEIYNEGLYPLKTGEECFYEKK